MNRLRRAAASEDGQALVIVAFLIFALSLISGLLLDTMLSTTTRSADASRRAHARAAAEAGLDDYISKLLEDNQYYRQYLAPGEATRQASPNPQVASVLPPASPTPWPSSYGTSWTYPKGKDAWVDLGNGYSYDLELAPPHTGSNTSDDLQITATGKPNSGGNGTVDWQVIQVLIRPASVADFQMFSAVTVAYGSDAVTTGKIYSSGSINFAGCAYADLYAWSQVNLSGTCGNRGVVSPAGAYDSDSSPTVKTKLNITQPYDFGLFQTSLSDISRAAQNAGGIYLPDNGSDAYELTFFANGTVSYASCTQAKDRFGRSQPIETLEPTCGSFSTPQAIPQNGAIYSNLPVIIGGNGPPDATGCPGISGYAVCVGGRVTVASNQDIVIGDNIGYANPTQGTDGTDVLGLIANQNVYVADWVPNSVTWRAATLAENGRWGEYSDAGNYPKTGKMTFIGSTATAQGGSMSGLFPDGSSQGREYDYDPTLQYLQPPWFPTLGSSYTIDLYRNMPNAS